MANWTMVIDLRSMIPRLPVCQFPFKTVTGLNEDNTKAGYKPARNKLTKNIIPVKAVPISQLKENFVCNNLLKKGRQTCTNPKANEHAMIRSSNDSNRNWAIN